MIATPAFAQAAGAAGEGNFLVSLLPLILIVVVMYFLLIRPQQKRMKQHREMIGAVRRGDTIVTAGGVVGKVTKVTDEQEIDVEISKGVTVKVLRATIAEVRAKSEPVKAENENASKPKKTSTRKPRGKAAAKDKAEDAANDSGEDKA